MMNLYGKETWFDKVTDYTLPPLAIGIAAAGIIALMFGEFRNERVERYDNLPAEIRNVDINMDRELDVYELERLVQEYDFVKKK